jgi:outer membrane protein, adhesin transport system
VNQFVHSLAGAGRSIIALILLQLALPSVAAAGEPATDPSAESPPAEVAGSAAPRLDTLSQIIRKVWTDNPQVRQAEQVLRARGYDVAGAKSGYFPFLQVQSIFQERASNDDSNVDVVLPLWSGGSTIAEVDEAKGHERSAVADLIRTRLELGQRVLETYLAVALAQESAIQWSNYVGALKQLLATIRRRADKGVAPQADVQTAIARLRQAEAGAEANRAALAGGRAQLASLLNAQPGAVDWPEDANLLSDLEIAEAGKLLERHPAHLAAVADLEIQEATMRRSRAALWPEVQLVHRWELEGSSFDVADSRNLLVLQYQSNNNGLRAFRGWQADRERIEAARARITAIDQDIGATIEVDRTQLRAAAQQLVVQDQAAEAANSLVDSFIRQFEVGRRSWLEVLNAQREAHEAILQSLLVKRTYWLANTKLALDSMYWHRLDTGAAASGVPQNQESP